MTSSDRPRQGEQRNASRAGRSVRNLDDRKRPGADHGAPGAPGPSSRTDSFGRRSPDYSGEEQVKQTGDAVEGLQPDPTAPDD